MAYLSTVLKTEMIFFSINFIENVVNDSKFRMVKMHSVLILTFINFNTAIKNYYSNTDTANRNKISTIESDVRENQSIGRENQ